MNTDHLFGMIAPANFNVGFALKEMAKAGTSVLLNWGEDTNAWECSWITGGKRYTGVNASLEQSIRESVQQALATMVGQ